MYSIKFNPLFVEISKYNKRSDGIKLNDFRKRNYEYEAGMRAKNKVIDFALNNNFTHFITITLDKNVVGDRTDKEYQIKRLRKFFNNWKNRYESDFKYLIVPEFHKNKESNGKKAIHFHGFIYTKKMHLDFLKQKDQAQIYRCSEITENFGVRNEFTVIYNTQEFVAYYISKYISKKYDVKISNHRYFKSQKLKTSDVQTFENIEGFENFSFLPFYQNQFTKKWKIQLRQWEFIKEHIKLVDVVDKDFDVYDKLDIDSICNDYICNDLEKMFRGDKNEI